MDLGLDKRVVVITGGGSGIGKACARQFAKEGCRVAICGRNVQRLNAAVDEFRREGLELFSGVADATNHSQLRVFAASVAAQYGGIDVWINNAGKAVPQYLLEIGEGEFEDIFRQNVMSVFAGSKIAAEHMKERGGVIVNASSFAALMPSSGRGPYAAAKAAVSSLTRSFAAELGPYGIRVLAYAPGVVATEMSAPLIEVRGQMLAAATALNRIGKTEEIAKTIVILASDAASYITGTTIDISGGKFCVQDPASEYSRRK
jgi:3-oxoacyl-[acyl-carrier protein] reductase